MPEPVTVKRPSPASVFKQHVVALLFVPPVIVLFYYLKTGRDFYFSNWLVNTSAHLALVIMPVIWALLIFRKPLVFGPSSPENVVGVTGYFSTFTKDWWMSLNLWAPAILVMPILLHQYSLYNLGFIENRSAGSALFTVVLTFGMASFYISMLGERSPVSVSEEGLRTGLIRFHEWSQIDRVLERDGVFEIYHRVNPRIPYMYLKLDEPEKHIFREFLLRYNVSQFRSSADLFPIKMLVVVLTAAIVGTGMFFEMKANIDPRWILAGSVGVTVAVTLLFEQYRGIMKMKRVKPIIEPEA